jgi:hypothetical protein
MTGKAVKNAMSLTYQVKQLRVVICTDSAESKRVRHARMRFKLSANIR